MTPSPPAAGAAGIDWHHASSDADVDAAFRQARAEAKPVFLYWGAAWCPPCNQVKATLFSRQDFIERSRAFVAVYVDGDSPGAQKIGARFHVSGYPTMLLFGPDGTEVTRLPGEVDPARYIEVVTLGMNARRPVKAVLADALGTPARLAPNDWRLLAFYSWDTDEQQLVPKREVAPLLRRLSAACPAAQAETAARLWLKSLAAADEAHPLPADAGAADRLRRLLADDRALRAHFDVLSNSAADIVRAVVERGRPERKGVLTAYDAALARTAADASLSRADRIGALIARVDLATIDAPRAETPAARAAAAKRIPAALRDDIRAATTAADREITDGYERQAVITAAADLLRQAGLLDESDALLKSNLAKSHSPYYLMTGLAENAAQRGDPAEALRWHREAYEQSEGPATRLQWGARYVTALVQLAPRDETQIDRAANGLLNEAAAQPNVFYERSARSLRRVDTQLRAWNRGGAHEAVVERFHGRLAAICAGLAAGDAQRATCNALLKPEPKPAA